MCGIAGIVRPQPGPPIEETSLRRMARAIHHRGPDGFGLALERGAGFVSTRLAIVDLPCGWQPIETGSDGTIVFGSEAKALFASGEVDASPDLTGIDDVFTLWGPRPPRTAFAGVSQLGPGCMLVWERGSIVELTSWWTPTYVGGPEAD